MGKENIDPAYKYVDKQIKSVRKEIRQLTEAQRAISEDVMKQLLELQQVVSGLKVNSDVDIYSTIINHQLQRKGHSLIPQLLTDAATAKANIRNSTTSKDAWQIVLNFKNKWSKSLKDLGAELISY